MTHAPGYPARVTKSMPAAISGAGNFITTLDAAHLLACTPRTVVRLITAGHLPATRLGPGKSSWRVTETDLLAFTQRWGHHSPADVADSLDPDRLPTPAPPLGLLTTRRTAEGLQMIELQHPDPDLDA